MESSEINPHIYGQLIKKPHSGKIIVSSINDAGKTGQPHKK